MGNQHSSRAPHPHPPAQWTQSFPRDHRRLHKMGVSTDNRVLPERGPVQRLRTTENGRSLHVAGTITGRRVSQPLDHHPAGPQSLPGFMRPMTAPCQAHPSGLPLHTTHSNSMTHLHQQCALHPSQNMEQSRAGSMHELRFGGLPTKVYTSEPDLRVGGSIITPIKHSPPHTIISQSPTKGRIKSKKRTRAPPPPVNKDGTFSDGYITEHHRMNSEGTRAVHWGTSDTQSRPSSQVSSYKSKGKGRKVGLFKKRNESKKSDNESSFTDDQSRTKPRNPILSTSDKEERRERARSVDCLRYELRRRSHHISNSDLIGRGSSSDETSSSNDRDNHHRSQTIERDSRRKGSGDVGQRLSTTLERNPKGLGRESNRNIEEYRSHNRVEERRSNDMQSNRNYLNSQFTQSNSYGVQRDKTPLERRTSSTTHIERSPINKAFDEWEEAEKEVLRRKRISENMKQELLTVAKSMKKSSEEAKPADVNNKNVETRNVQCENKINISSTEKSRISTNENDTPKTFFFGMEPGTNSDTAVEKSHIKKTMQPPVSKIVQTEAVRIDGISVGYSKRNNDIIERSRSKSKENASKISNLSDRNLPTHKDGNDIDEFAVSIERRKQNLVRDELLGSSIKREDGGYHSRQNSGSFHLENENPSDEERGITVNLRPILPKRQREIPRFSPNAAWRFLGEEPFLADENNLNESRSSEEVDVVFEDKIRGYARPVAPPRGSGEKSADSGISGDAGSPGPMQEFEPIIPSTSVKIVNNGPLAASSPVASGRSELRRAWTPAQDLDDNSLDGSGNSPAHRAQQTTILTPPKLTSRANMFTLFGVQNDSKVNDDSRKNGNSNCNKSIGIKSNNTVEESTQTLSNFHKLKRSVSGSINAANNSQRNNSQPNDSYIKSDSRNIQTDKWRDNWSMTRSIPNSLNNCDETDIQAKSSKQLDCSKSDLNPSPYRQINGTDNQYSLRSCTSTSQQNGHIMYLPEYNSRKIPPSQDFPSGREIRSKDLNSSKYLNRSYTSDDQTPQQSRNSKNGNEPSPISLPNFFAGNSALAGRPKRGKKFSYQSTVRVLEKKKIEEKLNREVAAKEQQRLREAAAMRQVEEEFQLKREREKKRLKQQLKIYQAMQSTGREHPMNSPTFTRNVSLNYPDEASDVQENSSCTDNFGEYTKDYINLNKSSRKSFDNNQPYDISNGFQSSKVDYHSDNSRSYSNDSSKEYTSNGDPYLSSNNDNPRKDYYSKGSSKDEPVQPVLRIVSRDDHLNGRRPYNGDDTRSSTVSSVSGLSVDGRRQAPDGAPAPVTGPRAEAVAAARNRNGLLTQELPEHQFPRREYREYRRSHRSSSAQGGGVGDNYRRDFSRGQVQQLPGDDRSSRQSSDGRPSQDGRSDLIETASATSSITKQTVAVKTHVVRTTQTSRGVTKFYEHPPALVNMSPAQGAPDEAFNRLVMVQPYLFPRVQGSQLLAVHQQ